MYKSLNNRCLGRKPVTRKFDARAYAPATTAPRTPHMGFALLTALATATAFMVALTLL